MAVSTESPAKVGTNFAARVFGHECFLDTATFLISSYRWRREELQTPRLYVQQATSASISSHHDVIETLRLFPPKYFELESYKPELAYAKSDISPPEEFVTPNHAYVAMSPEQRSDYMKGNIKLASQTVLWAIADRVGSWPSLVDSIQLKKVMKLELAELIETTQIYPGEEMSSMDRALSRDKNVLWYEGRDAKNTWDVESEIVDIAFCSLQHWLGYDGFTVEKCIDAGKIMMQKFDAIDDKLSNDDLKDLISQLHDGQIGMSDYFWAEMQLGIAYLFSKRIGVDLWEGITLKCLTNVRQYPNNMQLVENGVERRLDEARTPAWVFMKNLRVRFNKEKRFIPPMSDPFARETVLDQIYGSPYLHEDIIDLVGLVSAAQKNGLSYAVPQFIAESGAYDRGGNNDYY